MFSVTSGPSPIGQFPSTNQISSFRKTGLGDGSRTSFDRASSITYMKFFFLPQKLARLREKREREEKGGRGNGRERKWEREERERSWS